MSSDDEMPLAAWKHYDMSNGHPAQGGSKACDMSILKEEKVAAQIGHASRLELRLQPRLFAQLVGSNSVEGLVSFYRNCLLLVGVNRMICTFT